MTPSKKLKTSPSGLELGVLIGHGVYGEVRTATSGEHGEVAVKKIKPLKGEHGVPHNAVREIAMLRELKHEHIVNLLDVFMSTDEASGCSEVNLVLDLSAYDLRGILSRHREYCRGLAQEKWAQAQVPLGMIRAMMRQLLLGVGYMHAHWVLNRDVKPDNILLTAEGTVKVADFGLARVFQAPPKPLVDDHTVVTQFYRAPELLLESRHYTPAVDVWSVGTVMGELIDLNYMFPGGENDPIDQLRKIFAKLGVPDAALWPTLPDMPRWQRERPEAEWDFVRTGKRHEEAQAELRERLTRHLSYVKGGSPATAIGAVNVLFKLLHYDPSRRISCQEALKEPFFEVRTSDNVLAEYGPAWKTFLRLRQKGKVQMFQMLQMKRGPFT